MRVSVIESDPGYRYDAHLYNAFLDGKEIAHCFTADEEIGKAWAYATDNDGQYIISGDGLEIKEVTGSVVIKRKGTV